MFRNVAGMYNDADLESASVGALFIPMRYIVSALGIAERSRYALGHDHHQRHRLLPLGFFGMADGRYPVSDNNRLFVMLDSSIRNARSVRLLHDLLGL
jgi:hypothetical protein